MTMTSTIDVSGLMRLSDRLRMTSPATVAKMRDILIEAGDLVKAEAEKRADKIMPHKAPKIEVKAYSLTAKVRAIGDLGKLFEAGGKGGKAGNVARWRHPTYGHKPWVSQQPQPYLVPALQSTRNFVMERMVEEINKLMDEYLGGVFK